MHMGPRIIREHKPSMVHSKFCGLQSFNSKKILLALGVIAWAAIFFLSGTLFIRRRYESANELVSKLRASLQERIDSLSSQLSEGKTSAKDLTQALHAKINLTLSSLDEKIDALEKDFEEKRQRAFHALHALHGGNADNEKAEPQPTIQQTAAPENAPEASGPIEMKSSESGMCIDSMEKPLGSDTQLFECHGQEGNQAWNYRESTRLIENKAKNMCLRAADGSEGSPVKTAACDVNDTQQKWNNIQRLLMLDDGAMTGKCLDADPKTKMLVIQHCDSTKESQHWTYHINSPAQ